MIGLFSIFCASLCCSGVGNAWFLGNSPGPFLGRHWQLSEQASLGSHIPCRTGRSSLVFLSSPKSTTVSVSGADSSESPPPRTIPYDPDLLYMGISEELDLLPKGTSLQKAFSFTIDNACPDNRTVEILKLSQRPPLFLLKGVLTPQECQVFMDFANSQPLQVAETRQGGTDSQEYRVGSQMTWIPNNTMQGLQDLAQQIHATFLPHEPCFHPSQSVEDLQVVHYDPDGCYNLHHDGALRILTVLYYLNGVSDTWFPCADAPVGRFASRQGAIDFANSSAHPSNILRGGVLASQVQPGDAIAFYNYFQDAAFEWNAIHAGLPATSDKWIATHWYHHVRPSQCNEYKTS
ncbi:ShK domain-like [Seminavis robusta]|uniref:ShK domain-like n=1 Tax=Seminavis robusta TaxID=568900 RepID=A0A9N8H8H7_9STRA|nr:ShK domain-like [Seminavis robusta]|eukprot:Sro241_g096310.1 ShK domain-like (348) ;mRNA; f:35936-36979